VAGEYFERSAVSIKKKTEDSSTPLCLLSKTVLIRSGVLMTENKLVVFGILHF